ncbi:MAG: CU044_2847 family protein [Leptolyngbyaceae cyanobacterium bins.302]|nr:CU044_2847 family protein [Leptolyngbyaceae cyanobacterium bins.302]
METPTQIIPVSLSDGTVVRVEAVPLGEQRVAAHTRPFSEITTIVRSLTGDLAEALQTIQREVAPKTITVKLGLEIGMESGQLTALIVKGAGKANLELSMEWDLQP